MPLNQTKEEEIGSLTEKQFRIMIVKMIQNFESIMELQINSLETRIKKLQEKFNKVKRQTSEWEKIIANGLTDKELFPRYTSSSNNSIPEKQTTQ